MGLRSTSCLALAGVFLALPALAPVSPAQVALRRIALTGDPAPGTPPGAFFDAFGTFPGVGDDFPPRLDADGNCAFHAVLAGSGVTGVNLFDGNAFGVWKQVAGVTSLVARQDDPAPGTATGVELASGSGRAARSRCWRVRGIRRRPWARRCASGSTAASTPSAT
jgi:hypothetical protein